MANIRLNELRLKSIYGSLKCEMSTFLHPTIKLIPKYLSYEDFRQNDSQLARFWPSVKTIYLPTSTSQLTKNQIAELGDVDLVTAVCPCSGLSGNNTAREGVNARGSEAAKNIWMIETAKLALGQLRPKVFIGENAAELATACGRVLLERLGKVGKSFGYSLSVVKTCTSLHGLPQRRQRSFYFFWRTTLPPLLPWISSTRPDLSSLLASIPPSADQQDLYLYPGVASQRYRPYQFLLEKYNLTHPEFYAKMTREFPGSNMTVARYLERHGLLEECISWLQQHYPKESLTSSGMPHHQSLQTKLDKTKMK